MANELSALLRTPPLQRRAPDYEKVCDDFVSFAGGSRVEKRFIVPRNTRNADYYFDQGDYDLILELKQISTFRPVDTVDAYFSARLREGKVKRFTPLGNGKIRIEPDSLTLSDWNHFYKRFRPSITTQLDKAASQLKATDAFLPATRARRIRGAMLVNSGDYNLSTDLLFRLVEWRVKDKWKNGRYSALDFVTCVTLDLLLEDRHPFHGRHIVRTMDDSMLEDAVTHLYDRWIHYGADAIGATVRFDPTTQVGDDPIKVSTPVRGKRRWVE